MYTKDQLIQVLQDEYNKTGNVPTGTKKRNVARYHFSKHFGNWRNALKAAEIPQRKELTPIILEKKCPNCNEAFSTLKTKETTYCSTRCSNESRRTQDWKPRQKRTDWLKSIREESYTRMMDIPFDELGWDTKRKRIIQEQSNKCGKCGIDNWLGESLPIEIDHIDGNHTNNNRENLIGLCPNCHSITPTWRGRNKANISVTDEELTRALKETDNIRQALLKVGMAAKGANYRRATHLKNRMK